MLKALSIAAAVVSALAGVALAHGPHQQGGHAGHGHAGHGAHFGAGEPGDAKHPSRDVEIVMSEGDGRMLFEPSLVKVKVGEQIRFRLRNAGLLEHEFLLGTPDEIAEHADLMKAAPDMQHDDPNAKRLATKASGDLVWRFTQAGRFEFACLIPGHREAGMTGIVEVE